MLELSSKMEFPEEQYYRANRVLLSIVGLWPYDDRKASKLRFIISLLILISFTSAQFMKLFVSESNFDMFLKIISFDEVFIVSSIKYVTFYAVMENIKGLQERVRINWSSLTDNQEIKIIRNYARTGKLFTIFITTFAYFGSFFLILTQYISIFLDITIPLNESRPRELLFLAEYFIDQEKYFHIIAIHLSIGMLLVITSIVAMETFSLVSALHSFGLFKIASYRLEHVLSNVDPHMCIIKKHIIFRGRIVAAVDFHRRAIEFSDLTKACFGRMYLALFVVLVFSASINLLYLSRIIMEERKTLEFIKTLFFLMTCFIYLVVANYAGQEYINSDTEVYRTICNMQWYNAPLKTQNLILFLIQKTTKCYKVDAGGMFTPSLEGLATGLSMSVSYCMVLSSI